MRNMSGLRKYKPGQSGNPAGRRKGITVPKLIQQYTATLVAETYNKLINMEMTELRVLSRSMSAPALEVIVARAMVRELSEGTLHRTDTILDRIIGKVPNKQEVTGAAGVPLMPPTIMFASESEVETVNGPITDLHAAEGTASSESAK